MLILNFLCLLALIIMPVNQHLLIGIDWLIAFLIIDFHRLVNVLFAVDLTN